MTQFYIPPADWKPGAESLRLTGDEARHARDVSRLEPGDPIRVFNGLGQAASGRVRSVSKHAVEVEVGERLPAAPEPVVRIDLAQALVPHEAMDEVVRQASELGAARIRPIACERSIVRLDADKRASKLEHWNKTALAACKQCDRNTLPEVLPVASAKDLPEHFAEYDIVLIACPQGPEGELDLWKTAAPQARRILIAIGPEGDFSPEEIRRFTARGARIVSLGPLILKSDTAAVSAMAVLQFLSRR
jgi:16S rRNA (uracil1498-N3)-methyltransferase